ncbi:outer membrane lipoprotein carrier protein LolA [Motiliproteus sp. MSK22-1]|uniref:outer membrane lipoprotein carrier protein LolA n=1 Tax=Motiliproteus sp. MSK22-1 TaxID=1897630 RepID=UPI00097595F1|nr:outer membrane lipoprotein carrier protein LolA [Motiliproteus sp. MSK22-1]OMH31683.1 hypothetical protein BGP75_16285 [Motiliproteus sp. MSK22-1]
MNRYLLFFLLLLSSASYAELTFKQLDNVSEAPEQLSGHFTQEKYLSALDTSLISTGLFYYHQGQMLQWKTLKPIQNELVMTPSAIINKQGDQELLRLDTNSNPIAGILSEIFFSALAAEWNNLAMYFELSGEINGKNWYAKLLPTDRTMAQVISLVELKGDTLLRELIFHEKSGDRTTIRFDRLNQ